MVDLINSIFAHTIVFNSIFLIAGIITAFQIYRRKR